MKRRILGQRAAALGQCRPGGRARRAAQRPFTVWPPMLTLGRSGDEQLAAAFRRALAAELQAVGISLDYTPVLDIHTNPKNPVIGDRCARRKRRTMLHGWERRSSKRCRRKALRRAASIFPVMAIPASIRISSCRSSSIRPIGSTRWSSCRSRPRSRRTLARIMTAQSLMPALDDERPATLSPASSTVCSSEKLGYQGLVVTDDIEMKAISARIRPRPRRPCRPSRLDATRY